MESGSMEQVVAAQAPDIVTACPVDVHLQLLKVCMLICQGSLPLAGRVLLLPDAVLEALDLLQAADRSGTGCEMHLNNTADWASCVHVAHVQGQSTDHELPH